MTETQKQLQQSIYVVGFLAFVAVPAAFGYLLTL